MSARSLEGRTNGTNHMGNWRDELVEVLKQQFRAHDEAHEGVVYEGVVREVLLTMPTLRSGMKLRPLAALRCCSRYRSSSSRPTTRGST